MATEAELQRAADQAHQQNTNAQQAAQTAQDRVDANDVALNDAVPGAERDANRAALEAARARQNVRKHNTPLNRQALREAQQRQIEANRALAEARQAKAQAQQQQAGLAAAKRQADEAVADSAAAAAEADRALQLQRQLDELGKLQSQLGKIQSEKIAPAGAKLHTSLGIDFHVKGDWTQFILGKWERKVVGSEHKVVLVHGNSIHVGRKGELMVGGKMTWISGSENKLVVGAAVTNVVGLKKDVVQGTKRDYLLGPKFESHLGTKVTIGDDTQSTAAPTKMSLRAMMTVNDAEDQFKAAQKQSVSVKSESNIKKVLAKVGTLKATIDSLKETCNTHMIIEGGTYEHEGTYYGVKPSGKATFKASGDLVIKGPGGHCELTGGHAQLKHGGQTVECNGKTTVKGADIEFE